MSDFFEMDEDSPYMLFVAEVRPEWRPALSGVTHIDGTARVQVVDSDLNPDLHEVLEHFYGLTGIPVLLNTSFNNQEPIVHSPEGALATFSHIPDLKYLIVGDYLVRKK